MEGKEEWGDWQGMTWGWGEARGETGGGEGGGGYVHMMYAVP